MTRHLGLVLRTILLFYDQRATSYLAATHNESRPAAPAASYGDLDTVTRGAVSTSSCWHTWFSNLEPAEAVFRPTSEFDSCAGSSRAALHARGLASSPARSPADFRRSEARLHSASTIVTVFHRFGTDFTIFLLLN